MAIFRQTESELMIGFKVSIINFSFPLLNRKIAFLILIKFKFSLSIELINKTLSKKLIIFKGLVSKLLSIMK